jgi:hypothetical protein
MVKYFSEMSEGGEKKRDQMYKCILWCVYHCSYFLPLFLFIARYCLHWS